MNEEEKIKIKTTSNHFLAAWKAIQNVVKNGVPDSAQDEAFLMECLGDLAKAVDKTKTDEEKMKLRLSYKKWRGIWHCLNVCCNNKMYMNEGQQGQMLMMQAIIATKLDAHVVKPTLEIVT